MSERKPTAVDAIILKHEGRATQHGSATYNEMMKLAAAARREVEVLRELCEATSTWMEWLVEKHKNEDWKCPYVANIAEHYNAYRLWLAEQEKQA